jgi:hypothetical protein
MKLAYFRDLLICIGSSAGVAFPWAVPREGKVKRYRIEDSCQSEGL